MTWEYSKTELVKLAGRRVIAICDGTLTYYAAMRPRQRWTSAVQEFVRTYNWSAADEKRAEDLGISLAEARADLVGELCSSMYVERHARFAARRNP